MQITKEEAAEPLKQTFHLHNFPIAYSNGLRRSFHADVCTLAFDKANLEVFDPELPAEFFAHRIGMVPLYAPQALLDELSPYYECPNITQQQHPQDCQECTVVAHLRVEADHLPLKITDEDIIFDNKQVEVFSIHNRTAPIPLFVLAPGEEITATIYARKAPGRVHAKFSPVAAVTLQPKCIIKISKIQKVLEEEPQAALQLQKVCPRGVFDVSGGKLRLIKAEKCTFCDDCCRQPFYGIDLPIETTPDYSDIKMDVESAGGMQTEEIVLEGLLAMSRGLVQVIEELDIEINEGDDEKDVLD